MVCPERLADAVHRLREACGRSSLTGLTVSAYQPEDRICFRTPGRTLVAAMSEVGALEADGDFTRIYVASQLPLMICQTLGAYEQSLPAPPFLRLDRSLMLNIHRISKIEHLSRDETVITLDGISRTFSAGRKAWTTLREAGVTG